MPPARDRDEQDVGPAADASNGPAADAEADSTDGANDGPDGELDGVARDRDASGQAGGLSFRLPPIRLPEFFPPDFELRLPIPGGSHGGQVSARTVLVACIAFDAFDAVVALLVGSQLVGGARAVGGLALAATVAGVTGLAYGWELLAVLLGYPELTAVPSLTVLLVLYARK